MMTVSRSLFAATALALSLFAVPALASETETTDEQGEEHAAPPPVNWVDFGYKSKNAEGEPLAAGDEPMAPPFVLALVNFAIFGFIIVKMGGPKVQSYLAGRHETVKHELAEAARLRLEAENKLAEYGKRVAEVNREVDTLIAEIRADADAEKQRILDDAATQAAAMKRDAEERIASEIARARAELEREVVAAAVAAADKILRERTTPADQKALFDGFLGSLTPAGKGGPAPTGTPTPTTDDDAVSKGWS
jgi:F-type H+-transporting ATPase subunit b